MFRWLSLALAASLVCFACSGCNDDNPVDGDNSVHAEAEGLVLRLNGVEIVRVDSGVVSGAINATEGQQTALIHVRFLDADGDEFLPSSPDFHLGFTIADLSVIEIEQHAGEVFDFHVTGLEHGQTSLVVRLIHVDHDDFLTPPIPVTVEPAAGEEAVVGLVLEQDGQDVVTVESGVVNGQITATAGSATDHFDVFFISEDGGRFQPQDSTYSLGWSIADESVAGFEFEAGELFGFLIHGLAAGNTTLTLHLLHEEHPDFVAPPIPIVVAAPLIGDFRQAR